MASLCSIMSRASVGDKGTVGDLNSRGLELSKVFFSHLSGTGIGMTQRLVSVETAPLRPACGFSMYLECLIGWQLGSKNEDSKRSRQKPWGLFGPSLNSHRASPSPCSIDQSSHKTIGFKGRNIDPTSGWKECQRF